MEISVSVPEWLKLPMEMRIKLRDVFKVPKSQGSWVENNEVRSDGHTHQDLQSAITVEAMQNYTGSKDTDFLTLFHLTLNQAEQELIEIVPVVEKPDPVTALLEEWAMHLNRIKTQSENLGLTDHLKLLISKLFPNDDKRIPTTYAAPEAPASRNSKGENKKEGVAGRSTKAKKDSNGSNISNTP